MPWKTPLELSVPAVLYISPFSNVTLDLESQTRLEIQISLRTEASNLPVPPDLKFPYAKIINV